MIVQALFKQIIETLFVIPEFQIIDKKYIQKIEFRTTGFITINSFIEIKIIKPDKRAAFSMCSDMLKTAIQTFREETDSLLDFSEGIMIDSTDSVYLIISRKNPINDQG